MVCTFGDQADVEFWRGQSLPLAPDGPEGRMRKVSYGESPFMSESRRARRPAGSKARR